MISDDSVIAKSSEPVSSQLHQETIILDTKAGVYYNLNDVGTSIWNFIAQPRSIAEIKDTLLAEYEVESQECDRQLQILLKDLLAKGLIEVKNEATREVSAS
ncbi:MAG: PqqD family peptide modification chaperone [Oscillatoria sp. PMC 1051.18]|nr:PqqD family peptide modification chaperone [Oscillatoria sp. PMC 1050.18]MEC5031853.1 PqqD family peptide modification chaperone [Oscillatoria sp. PMC 1051.18]